MVKMMKKAILALIGISLAFALVSGKGQKGRGGAPEKELTSTEVMRGDEREGVEREGVKLSRRW